MDSELSDACLNAIQNAKKPISLSEIGAVCLGRSKPNAKLVEVLKQLAGRAVIHQWPTYRRSQIFGSRPLRSAVEDAFVATLEHAPLTVAQAAKPISQLIGRVSEKSVLAELRYASGEGHRRVQPAAGFADLRRVLLRGAREARRRLISSISNCCGSKSPPHHSSNSL